jgi:hypothetical protein
VESARLDGKGEATATDAVAAADLIVVTAAAIRGRAWQILLAMA